VQLRLAGLSRSQICAALGLRSGGRALSTWLRHVPAAAWTARPNAKDDLHEKAVLMRREGRSYREIREVLGVSKSTLSLWLRAVPLTYQQRAALAARTPAATSRRAEAIRETGTRRRLQVQASAREQVQELSESELFVAGVVAYWAEGTKNKPWRTGTKVRFMNSDPNLIKLFLEWLALVGVGEERIVFRLHIHESADVAAALRFWRDTLGVPESAFLNTVRKRHRPRTVRKNVGEHYHGCLCVEVRRSADLNLQIEGWCEGLARAARL
jgi:hypothetical protein